MNEIVLNNNHSYYEIVAAVSGLVSKGYQVTGKYRGDAFSDGKNYISIKKINHEYIRPFELYIPKNKVGEFIEIRLDGFRYNIEFRIKYNSIIYRIDSNIRSMKANDIECYKNLKENNFKSILDPILKVKFIEENFNNLIDFIDLFRNFADQDQTSEYSISALSEFEKVTKLINSPKLIYKYIEQNKIDEFIDFLDRFRNEKDKTILNVDFRKIKVFRKDQNIKIYFSSLCVFNETYLEKFKYIPHPGLYLALHVLESDSSLKNKFLKEKLKKI